MKTGSKGWHRALVALVAVSLFALMGTPPRAEDEVLTVAASSPGVKFESQYQHLGNGEMVSPFSGGLTVTHPSSIGLPGNMGGEIRPVRVFNTMSTYSAYNELWGNSLIHDRPAGPLGVGWHLGMGRVFTRIINAQYTYFYQDESGAEHHLYDAYYDSPPPPQPQVHWYVTDDGSYIRARFVRAALTVDRCDRGLWTLYFPDGSVRIAGDRTSNAFVAAEVSATPEAMVTNPWSNGWYVTQITDRAGNTTTVKYRRFDPTLSPFAPAALSAPADPAAGGGGPPPPCPILENGAPTGFAGSIDAITDPFGRMIQFTYGVDGAQPAPHSALGSLLWKIQCPGVNGATRTEVYSYTFTDAGSGSGWEAWPVLSAVMDAGGLVTRYEYYPGTTIFPPATQPLEMSFLKTIFYPTGGRSSYDYQLAKTRFYSPITRQSTASPGDFTTFAVRTHTLEYRPEPGVQAQKLTWRWRRLPTRYPLLFSLGYGSMPVQIVVTSDPLGKEEVRYFATQEWTNPLDPPPAVPPGTELLRTVRRPGAPPLDLVALRDLYLCEYPDCPPATTIGTHYNVWEQVISWERKEYEFGGGDAARCLLQFGLTDVPDPHGNARPWRVVQAEIAPGAVQTNFSCGLGTCMDGTSGAKWVKEVKAFDWNGFGQYERIETRDLTPGGDTTVKLARSTYTPAQDLPWRSALVGYMTDLLTYSASGSAGTFRAVAYVRDATTGLVTNQHWYVNPQTSIDAAVTGAGDKYLAIVYTAQGNISKLTYSGGDSTATYGFNFTWDHGMVSQMSRDNSPYGVEFNREIDPNSSLITAATDPNSLTTSFEYDALNRLTKIIPPNSEYATYVSYPNDSTTAGGATWTTSHDILFYRGPGGFTPTVTDDLTGLDVGAAYQHYIFDDLGRLVKTRSIHPDGYLTETMTAYDPLGNVFFTSLPYRFDTPPLPADLDWGGAGHDKLPNDGDTFVSQIVMNPQTTASPYGSATSLFSGASWPSAANPGLEKFIAGDREPFDRAVWAFKPDGNRTKTTYSGLDSAVTLFEIKTGEAIVPNSESTTWYRKDIWGRLKRVEPPIGTTADYSYNGLDQLREVNLSGQKRSFTYDALGRILSAQNPENGLTTYRGYDCIGNLLAAQDANGAAAAVPYRLVNSYDALGRLLTTVQANASTGAPILTLLENTYDRNGGVTLGASLGKLVASVSRQKRPGANGPVVEVSQRIDYTGLNGRPDGGTTGSDASGQYLGSSYGLAYDAYGQVVLESLPGTAGTIANAHAHGAMTARVDATRRTLLPLISGMEYTVAGALRSYTPAGAGPSEAGFDAFERPIGFGLKDAAGALLWGNGSYADAGMPYTYDGAGNIATIGALGPAGPRNDEFTYDPLSRLTNAKVWRKDETRPHDYAYGYDPFGNLTSRSEAVPAGFSTLAASLTPATPVPETVAAYIKQINFTAAMKIPAGATVTNNQLGSVTRGGGATGVAAVTLTNLYDPNGNLTDDGQFTYSYDALNRQVAVYKKGTTVPLSESFYDAAGERVAKLDFGTTAPASYTEYLREGSAVVWEKTTSVTNAVPELQKSYVYAGGRMAYTKEASANAFTGGSYLTRLMAISGSGTPPPAPTLGEPAITYPGEGEKADLSYLVQNLGPDVVSLTVQLTRVRPPGDDEDDDDAGEQQGDDEHADDEHGEDGESDGGGHHHGHGMKTQTVSQPGTGWAAGTAVVYFSHLKTRSDYTVALSIKTMVGTLPVLGPRTVEVETGTLSIPRNPSLPRCWAHHKWIEDGLDDEGHHKVTDAMEVGWANVASAPGSLYNVTMTANGQTVPLTATPVTGTQTLITAAALGSTWCTPGGSTLGVAPVGGGVGTTLPPPDFCIDPVTGIAYTYTFAAYATDHLGTVRAIYTTNPDGTTGLQTFDYEPFGVEITSPNDIACGNTHRFTGHERDAETGNDYMHFRYYGAGMGRFQKPDDVFDGASGNPQGWNLYAYVHGNPVNHNDPTGHKYTEEEQKKIAAGSIAALQNQGSWLELPEEHEPGGGGQATQTGTTSIAKSPWDFSFTFAYPIDGPVAGAGGGGGKGDSSNVAETSFDWGNWWNNYKAGEYQGKYWGLNAGQAALEGYADTIANPNASIGAKGLAALADR